jgi:hypothetical protein
MSWTDIAASASSDVYLATDYMLTGYIDDDTAWIPSSVNDPAWSLAASAADAWSAGSSDGSLWVAATPASTTWT